MGLVSFSFGVNERNLARDAQLDDRQPTFASTLAVLEVRLLFIHLNGLNSTYL